MVKPHFFKRALCEVLSLRSLVWLVISRMQRFDRDLGWAIRMLGCWCGLTALESAVIVAYRKADGVHAPPPHSNPPHHIQQKPDESGAAHIPANWGPDPPLLHQHSFIHVCHKLCLQIERTVLKVRVSSDLVETYGGPPPHRCPTCTLIFLLFAP